MLPPLLVQHRLPRKRHQLPPAIAGLTLVDCNLPFFKITSPKYSFLHYSATFFYQDGNPGACGAVHSDNDFICAIDQDRYGSSGNASPLCGQQVTITNTNNGKSVTVTIADDCPTCDNSNSIDLSVGAFQAIGSLSDGLLPSTSCIISYCFCLTQPLIVEWSFH